MANKGNALLDGTSGAVPVALGGTNSTTAEDARTALSAAVSGSNSDITALTGLTDTSTINLAGKTGTNGLVIETDGGLTGTAIKCWDKTNGGNDNLILLGNGSDYTSAITARANGYLDIAPQSSLAYDCHINIKNCSGYQAARATEEDTSGSLRAGFWSSQSVNDAKYVLFYGNMNTVNGGGMLLQGTGGTGDTEYSKHLVLWGNTASNTSKLLSFGSEVAFQENGSLTADAKLTLGKVSTVTGGISLANSASANLTTIQAGNATAAVTYTLPTADGNSGDYLQTSGAGALSWATVTSEHRMTSVWSMDYCGTGYKTSFTVTGSGLVRADQSRGGVQIETGVTAGSSALLNCNRQNAGSTSPMDWDNDPEMCCIFGLSSLPASHDGVWQICAGTNGNVAGSTGTLTNEHMGFIGVLTAGTEVIYASNSNGSTQTKTDITAGLGGNNSYYYRCIEDSGTNVKFYINGTLKATHTTNLPAGNMANLHDIGLDNGASEDTQWIAGCEMFSMSFVA